MVHKVLQRGYLFLQIIFMYRLRVALGRGWEQLFFKKILVYSCGHSKVRLGMALFHTKYLSRDLGWLYGQTEVNYDVKI